MISDEPSVFSTLEQQTAIPFSRVVLGVMGYRNSNTGTFRKFIPSQPSINGEFFDPEELAGQVQGQPQETLLERARRRGALDEWIPVTRFRAQGGVKLSWHGSKAKKMWRSWCAHVYGESHG